MTPIFSVGTSTRVMRGAWRDSSARRLGNRLEHDFQDLQPRLARLFQRLRHDVQRDPRDLDIHLQGGDPLAAAGHLEIHVAEMVLHAGDVGEDREAVLSP